MKILVAVLGTAGLWSVVLFFIILARLTLRWEAVTRSNSRYRMFYVAATLIAVASLIRLVRIGYLDPVSGPGGGIVPLALYDPQSWFYLCFYYLPLAVGVTISLALAWRNWGWLLRESRR